MPVCRRGRIGPCKLLDAGVGRGSEAPHTGMCSAAPSRGRVSAQARAIAARTNSDSRSNSGLGKRRNIFQTMILIDSILCAGARLNLSDTTALAGRPG